MERLAPCSQCGARISPSASQCPLCRSTLPHLRCAICKAPVRATEGPRFERPSRIWTDQTWGLHPKCFEQLFAIPIELRCADCEVVLSGMVPSASILTIALEGTYGHDGGVCPRCGNPSAIARYERSSWCDGCQLALFQYQQIEDRHYTDRDGHLTIKHFHRCCAPVPDCQHKCNACGRTLNDYRNHCKCGAKLPIGTCSVCELRLYTTDESTVSKRMHSILEHLTGPRYYRYYHRECYPKRT